MDLRDLQLQLEDAINSGTRNMEEAHRNLAENLLNELSKVENLADVAENLRSTNEQLVTSLYEFARNVNTVAGQTARDIIERFDG
ncbi:MAG: hypothetical protein KDK41_06230 [Leptospiraceae bacterium]|nr:hypothetical protein [Leptospiraceae bacterium]MCB1200224.1 hypothetical protein [Leptospiraceae bacterium]